MPIVITPTGQFINSETGNPVNLPPQRPDFGSGSTSNREMSAMRGMMGQGGAISDEERRLIDETNRGMAPGMREAGSGSTSDREFQAYQQAMQGQQQAQQMGGAMSDQEAMAMQQGQIPPMSIEEKLDILMRMGLSQDEAIEAVALENSLPATNPSEFGGARSEGEMGALSGVPTGGAMMPAPIPRPMQNPNSLERMRMEGRDRSFNPMDSIRPDNTPNT